MGRKDRIAALEEEILGARRRLGLPQHGSVTQLDVVKAIQKQDSLQERQQQSGDSPVNRETVQRYRERLRRNSGRRSGRRK